VIDVDVDVARPTEWWHSRSERSAAHCHEFFRHSTHVSRPTACGRTLPDTCHNQFS